MLQIKQRIQIEISLILSQNERKPKKNIIYVIENIKLMVENEIQIKSGTKVSVNLSPKIR